MARTLKDHLYQCPSKLSEELVKCMVSIYCWMRSDTSVKAQKVHTPFLSRSSTKAVPSRSGHAGDGQELSGRSMVEVSSISMDKNHLSSAAYAVSNYRLLGAHRVSFSFYSISTLKKLTLFLFQIIGGAVGACRCWCTRMWCKDSILDQCVQFSSDARKCF